MLCTLLRLGLLLACWLQQCRLEHSCIGQEQLGLQLLLKLLQDLCGCRL